MIARTRKHIDIVYVNHNHVESKYVIEPVGWVWGITKYNTEEQWLLMAIDAEDGVLKSFAVSGLLRGPAQPR